MTNFHHTMLAFVFAAATAGLASSSQASLFTITNFTTGYFNTNSGYEPVFSLDGQPFYPTNPFAWATTDPEIPSVGGTNFGSTSIVQPYAYYTFGDTSTNGNNSVLFGGFNAVLPTPAKLLPGSTNPSLYVNFSPPDSAALSANFSAVFAIRRPGGPQGVYTNRDSFGFTLWDTFGASQVARFMFNGGSPTVTPGTTNYGFQWFDASNTWQSNNSALTSETWQIGLQTIYRLNVTLSNNGTFDVNILTLEGQLDANDLVTNYAVVADALIISNGAYGPFGLDDINSLSIDWSLANADSSLPGANFMVVNQIDMTSVVPEPTTLAMLLLSAAGLFAHRQFRGKRCHFRISKLP